MALDNDQLHDLDPDPTDKLPILDGMLFDHDVEDDAVPMDAASLPPRPTLAHSVRSTEARGGRRDAEYDALLRALESARDAQSAATARTAALAADLAAARATISQVRHSLGERDAQLNALQREHARLQPVLDAHSKTGTQLEADLKAERLRYDAIAHELQTTRAAVAQLRAQLTQSAADLNATRGELGIAKTQTGSYLESLRTLAWRRGFDLNLTRESRDREGDAGGEVAQIALLLEQAQARQQELAGKTLAFEGISEENRHLRSTLEQTRGALERSELLVHALQRGDIADAAAAPLEWSGELTRLDVEHSVSYPLARRTRIGRAPGCELQIESASVSRHHALLLMGPRDVIIEDLNSTNGLIVNGRKISRQLLNDGDLVVIGEVAFQFSLKQAPRAGRGEVAEKRPAE